MISTSIVLHRLTRPLAMCCGLACAAVLVGCGGGDDHPVAAVKGKVTCSGKPVSMGTVIFTPVASKEGGEPGKPASAGVQSDGTFVLSTYSAQDGAIIGKHRVMYSPPEEFGEDDESAGTVEEGSPEEAKLAAERARKAKEQQKNACVLNGEKIVEVTADGPNDFTIELVPSSGAGAARQMEQ